MYTDVVRNEQCSYTACCGEYGKFKIMKQKVITPKLKDCYCGSKAKVVWMNYDNFQVHCIENDHRITPEMGSRHRAIFRWNNTLDKMKK